MNFIKFITENKLVLVAILIVGVLIVGFNLETLTNPLDRIVGVSFDILVPFVSGFALCYQYCTWLYNRK
jgi:hypothetical protein